MHTKFEQQMKSQEAGRLTTFCASLKLVLETISGQS